MNDIFLELCKEKNEYLKQIMEEDFILYPFGFFLGKCFEKDSRIFEKLIPYIQNELTSNSDFSETIVSLQRKEYEKDKYDLYIELKKNQLDYIKKYKLERVIEKLKSLTFDEMIKDIKDIFTGLDLDTSTLSDLSLEEYINCNILELIFNNYCETYNNSNRFIVPEKNNLVSYYKNHKIDLRIKDNYNLITIDEKFEIKDFNTTQIYDKKFNKYILIKEISYDFLMLLKKLKTKGDIKKLSLRPEYNISNNEIFIPNKLQEAFEFGSEFTFEGLGVPRVSKFFNLNNYDDSLWININNNEITFEELISDFMIYKDFIVTQVIHLEYDNSDITAPFITHIDHEYIFYTEEQYENRLTNSKQKGEGQGRFKTFKVDDSKIPFYLDNNDFFLYIVLDEYFINKDLIREYFEKILNKINS